VKRGGLELTRLRRAQGKGNHLIRPAAPEVLTQDKLVSRPRNLKHGHTQGGRQDDPDSEAEREPQTRSAAFMLQKRAGSASRPQALVLPGLLRRERRAPSASWAARLFPTSEFRLNRWESCLV